MKQLLSILLLTLTTTAFAGPGSNPPKQNCNIVLSAAMTAQDYAEQKGVEVKSLFSESRLSATELGAKNYAFLRLMNCGSQGGHLRIVKGLSLTESKKEVSVDLEVETKNQQTLLVGNNPFLVTPFGLNDPVDGPIMLLVEKQQGLNVVHMEFSDLDGHVLSFGTRQLTDGQINSLGELVANLR